MEFEEFAQAVDAAVRAEAAPARFDGRARWQAGGRNAALELVPPRNVSVTLAGGAGAPGTTWYPIDAALVPVVSKRIAAYLAER